MLFFKHVTEDEALGGKGLFVRVREFYFILPQ